MDEDDTDVKKPKGKKKGDTAKLEKKKKKKKKAKKKADPEPFLPWLHTPAKNEVLVPDLQAYACLFPLLLEWPALSFAFLEPPDAPRKTFPFATSIAVGTQAAEGEENHVQVLQLSGLRRFRKRKKPAEEEEEAAEEDADSESSEVYADAVKGLKVEPRVTHFSVAHAGTVNRLASMPAHPRVVATISDAGAVHVFNLTNAVAARRTHSLLGHRAEGYALAWARLTPWLLASGDADGRVLLHKMNGEGGAVEEVEFVGHEGSVEDIAWSPTEASVFASCSADRSIRFWDTTRAPGEQCAMTIAEAHAADVNVIAWNCKDTHLLASGGEDGVIKVWDLRQVAPRKANRKAPSLDPSACVAVFTFHRAAITSLDWHSTDASMLLAASRDDSVSVWDLSVERDDKAIQLEARHDGLAALPPQLMFLHQGQQQPSEAKWHPLLPSVVFSTALEGIHIWKPSTL